MLEPSLDDESRQIGDDQINVTTAGRTLSKMDQRRGIDDGFRGSTLYALSEATYLIEKALVV